jgi:general L-amino acid transport system substrate-binding protein
VHVRRGHIDDEWRALAVGRDMKSYTGFAAIRRVWSRVIPRKAARILALSSRQCVQSSAPALCSFASKTACNWTQTPAAFQSRSRRQKS